MANPTTPMPSVPSPPPAGEPGSTAARPGRSRRRRRRRWPLAIGVFLGVLLLMVGWVSWRYRQFEFVPVAGLEGDTAPAGDGANWLIVGTDSREGFVGDGVDDGGVIGSAETITGQRADTIMVARAEADGTVSLLSVPRDLWVPIVGGEPGRINGAYNTEDGRSRLVATVESALSIDINYYAEVNLAGFQKMVDAIGGVRVWFDHPARDVASGLNIQDAGCHELDGIQALSLVRSRQFEMLVDGQWMGEGSGDLGRTARQRQFLGLLARQASSSVSSGNALTADRLTGAVGENVVLGENAGITDLARLGRVAVAAGDSIESYALPVSDWTTSGGAQVLDLQVEAAQPTLEVFRTPGEVLPEVAEPDPTAPKPQGSGTQAALPTAEDLASNALPDVASAQDCES